MMKNNQQGFTLIEILVGLVIGLLTTLVILQVFSVFEGQKRSTTGTADAQVNGNIALYNIQREVQFAGYGLPTFDKSNSALLCPLTTTVNTGTAAAPVNTSIFPIQINDGGASADSISIRYAANQTAGIPVRVKAQASTVITVPNSLGCTVGDNIMLNAASTCVTTKVSAINIIANADDTITLADATGVALGQKVSCLGDWTEITYQVNANQLERKVTTGTGSPIVAEIVDMQAQYGISADANSNVITAWVDAAGTTWGNTASTPTVANRNRIKAIRIALVARNGLQEKTSVSSTCTSTNTAAPSGLCAWEGTTANPAPPLFANRASPPTGWANYRYRVFETVIPLRNMLWSKN